LLFVFIILPLFLHIPFVPLLITPLFYFSSVLVFVILSRSLRGWELKGVEVEGWKLEGRAGDGPCA
jgi:hypothetical protein